MSKLSGREFKKSLINVFAVFVGLIVFLAITKKSFMPSSALFLSGLLFFCVGLWRVVRHLGMFDSTIFSYKRMFRKVKGEFADYLQEHPYTERYVELLIVSAAAMVISQILALVVA